ncbi:hypothetical protein [Paracoccus sp. TOH]|uniref:hypothetical protein n=1 Tax=Paracoccus sp. TOH TaxID=1263728 RepID=UPI0025B04E21|nr:hypothetical protein [Paracoccus sp. TOH]WJS86649.1 hypothetical protein NBE95_19490 [Paracoccus sp. TOH]
MFPPVAATWRGGALAAAGLAIPGAMPDRPQQGAPGHGRACTIRPVPTVLTPGTRPPNKGLSGWIPPRLAPPRMRPGAH